jgi:hypothetical protein
MSRKEVIDLIVKKLESKGVKISSHYGYPIFGGGRFGDIPQEYRKFFKRENCGHYSVENVIIPKEIITENYDMSKLKEMLK